MSAHFRFATQCGTGPAGPIGPIGPIGPVGPTPMDPSGNLDLSCNNLLDVSGIYFCNGTSITTFSGECITISGCLDMSCNSIVDVSQVDFCDDVVLTKPATPGGIAIGYLAGYGTDTIAIGDQAGEAGPHNNTIILNATGSALDSTAPDSFYVNPIREASANNVLYYDSGTGEITYSVGGGGGLDVDCSNIIDISTAWFCDDIVLGTVGSNPGIAIGSNAGGMGTTPGGGRGLETGSIAIGTGAAGGNYNTRTDAIAIGDQAGADFQEDLAVAVGSLAATSTQGTGAVAIGHSAGNDRQDTSAVAIGIYAGKTRQGASSIAIGNLAGETDQSDNSIVLNATGVSFNVTGENTFYVQPIRPEVSNNVLYYDEGTGEITYGVGGGGGIDLSCSDIIDVSNIYFCNTDAILGKYRDFGTTYPGLGPQTNYPVLDISGVIDMSCNAIVDVSRIYFCGGPGVTSGRNWIGTGTSFDISCNETLRMTVPADASAVFQIGATNEMVIDASHVSISGGSVDTPALNFGLRGNSGDGMYYSPHTAPQSGPGPVIVAGGADRLHIGTSNVVVAVGNLICFAGAIRTIEASPDGDIHALGGGQIISGNSGATVGGGLVRASATSLADWEDGNCGNSSALVFTPSDFHNNALAARAASYCVQDSTVSRVHCGVTAFAGFANTIIATKLLPKGFIVPAGENAVIYSTVINGAGLAGGSMIITCTIADASAPYAAPTGLPVANVNPLGFPLGEAAAVVTCSGTTPTSDGLQYIAVKITTTTAGLTPTAGLVGVSVPIERA